MIKYTSKLLKRCEVWFDEEPTEEVDILTYHQRTLPVVTAKCTDFYTLITDLSKKSDELLQNFSKDTRYEIRRAEKQDEIIYEYWMAKNTNAVLTRFHNFYDRFAIAKKLNVMDRRYLKRLADAGVLDLSVVQDKEGNDLVWHAYYRNTERVRLLHSCSLFRENADNASRNLSGRANRLHHWRDMLRFKQEGILCYDFGGWYEGNSDMEKLRINQFKSEFGGTVVKNYNCNQIVTVKARILMTAFDVVKNIKVIIGR